MKKKLTALFIIAIGILGASYAFSGCDCSKNIHGDTPLGFLPMAPTETMFHWFGLIAGIGLIVLGGIILNDDF